MIAETYLVRHFLITQHTSEEGELENAYWLPGAENPADGLTRARSDMAPLLRLLESGCFNWGRSRPLKGAARKEKAAHVANRSSSRARAHSRRTEGQQERLKK